jgi:hypothetical protein
MILAAVIRRVGILKGVLLKLLAAMAALHICRDRGFPP